MNLIRKNNNKIIKNKKIVLKIKYEDKYIKNNIFKEFNLSLFKIILISIIILSLLIYTLFYFISKNHTNKTKDETNKINNIIESIDENNKNINQEKQIEVNNDIKTEKPKQQSAYFKNYSKAIKELKKINKDTVGWLSINNTTINYPVVKSDNNDTYLNKSFDGSKNPNGWIFMDYRNNSNDLDKNTILYGHSGNYYVMFGSLHKVLNKNWYTNKNNQIITFNIENKNIKWQIFSIYVIPNTNDYLNINFSDESFISFIDMIKKRRKYNFNVDVSLDDKILTLSTCYKDSKNRLVIHAKMIK